MPDVQGKLDEIITMVETAKGKALSGAHAVVDRAALLSALEDLRQLLPAEMSEARSLLRERADLQAESRAQADVVLGKAHAEADRLAAAARQERDRMVTQSALVIEARRVAAGIRRDVEAETQRMRDQTDDYVDASLARFEQLLEGSLETVARGRARVAATRSGNVPELEFADEAPSDSAAEESVDATEEAPVEAVESEAAPESNEAAAPEWRSDGFDSEGVSSDRAEPANQ